MGSTGYSPEFAAHDARRGRGGEDLQDQDQGVPFDSDSIQEAVAMLRAGPGDREGRDPGLREGGRDPARQHLGLPAVPGRQGGLRPRAARTCMAASIVTQLQDGRVQDGLPLRRQADTKPIYPHEAVG
ncbi:MAG: hypothetical protein MZV64_09585 [Ignavibacteriales bacterium]|nr:hypothetical protein [Ignavibacteriales bacterium]